VFKPGVKSGKIVPLAKYDIRRMPL